MRKRKFRLMTISCRRGCGKKLTTATGPINGTQADYDRYHGICDDCLTADEHADMAGPMLLRTARNITGG